MLHLRGDILTHAARHKTFISYHHEPDQEYADILRKELADDIIDKAVTDGSISDNLTTDAIWRMIRDEYISDATVTVVLIGHDTWSRKYVDWEIGSGFSQTKNNSRCGVLGTLLPDHPNYGRRPIDPKTLPSRLAANIGGSDPYVRIYDWPRDNRLSVVRDWIELAFQRRNGPAPNNNSKRFQRNRTIIVRDGASIGEILLWGATATTIGAGIVALLRMTRKRQTLMESTPTTSVGMTPPTVTVGKDLTTGKDSAQSFLKPSRQRPVLILSGPANSKRRRQSWLDHGEVRRQSTHRRRIVR